MRKRDVRERDVHVASVRAPVLEAGDASADQAAVFVHGNPGSARDWAPLVGQVGTFGRALALDMPGFGRADKPANFDYTVPGYARFLAGALELLGVRQAHLVLHDFGGPWGLAWAAAHPAAFRSVVLINTGVLPGYRWHYMARIWRTPIIGELSMLTATRTAFHLALSAGNPRGLPRDFIDRMYDEYDRGTRRAILKLYRASEPGALARQLGPQLQRLARPALVVWGAADPYIDAAYAARQRETFPDANVVMLERSGHWPFADDPEGVSIAVLPFLREQLTR